MHSHIPCNYYFLIAAGGNSKNEWCVLVGRSTIVARPTITLSLATVTVVDLYDLLLYNGMNEINGME